MFWIEWTCLVIFGDKQSGLTFSVKTVPSGHMLSISSCLYEEFTDYKTLPISELPDTALTDALNLQVLQFVQCCSSRIGNTTF